MKKVFLILAIAIVSLCVPGAAKAQDDSTSTETETQKDTSKLKISGVIEVGVSWRFGCDLGVGVRLSGSPSLPPTIFKVRYTFPNTSIGFSAMTYPFKKMKWMGLGFDVIDRYKCNWSLYSEFYYGGKGPNTFGSPETYWRIEDFICSVAAEQSTRIGGRCKLSLKTNLLWGFWSRSDGKWSVWKRYWNETVSLEILLGH